MRNKKHIINLLAACDCVLQEVPPEWDLLYPEVMSAIKKADTKKLEEIKENLEKFTDPARCYGSQTLEGFLITYNMREEVALRRARSWVEAYLAFLEDMPLKAIEYIAYVYNWSDVLTQAMTITDTDQNDAVFRFSWMPQVKKIKEMIKNYIKATPSERIAWRMTKY